MAGWPQWASLGRASQKTPEGPAIEAFGTSHFPLPIIRSGPLFRRRVSPSIHTRPVGDVFANGRASEDGSIVPPLKEPEPGKRAEEARRLRE
jgi:hypothetical protein